MKDDCSVCGAQLYGKEGASFYEMTHSHVPQHSYGEIDVVIPPTTHEYFCSPACIVKFVREQIEPTISA